MRRAKTEAKLSQRADVASLIVSAPEPTARRDRAGRADLADAGSITTLRTSRSANALVRRRPGDDHLSTHYGRADDSGPRTLGSRAALGRHTRARARRRARRRRRRHDDRTTTDRRVDHDDRPRTHRHRHRHRVVHHRAERDVRAGRHPRAPSSPRARPSPRAPLGHEHTVTTSIPADAGAVGSMVLNAGASAVARRTDHRTRGGHRDHSPARHTGAAPAASATAARRVPAAGQLGRGSPRRVLEVAAAGVGRRRGRSRGQDAPRVGPPRHRSTRDLACTACSRGRAARATSRTRRSRWRYMVRFATAPATATSASTRSRPVRPAGADDRQLGQPLSGGCVRQATRRRHLDVGLGATSAPSSSSWPDSLQPRRPEEAGRGAVHAYARALTSRRDGRRLDRQDTAEAEAHVAAAADDHRRVPLRARLLRRRRRVCTPVSASIEDRNLAPTIINPSTNSTVAPRRRLHRHRRRRRPSRRPETTTPPTFPPAEPGAKNFLITGADNNSLRRSRLAVRTAPSATGEHRRAQRHDHGVAVNPATSQVAVLSFPRDLWVTIDGRSSKQRINAAYERDNPQKLIDTIYQNFGIADRPLHPGRLLRLPRTRRRGRRRHRAVRHPVRDPTRA